MNSVKGFRSASVLTLASGWGSGYTCGSFWNIAATATSGRLLATASNDCRQLALMKKSSCGGKQNAVVGVGAARHDGDVKAV